MPHLSLFLLGPLQAWLDGQPVSGFRYDKVRALLAYLAVERDRPHRRESLLGLLWPELPEEAARNNLRQALNSLRHALGGPAAGPPFVLATRESVQWNADVPAWIDAVEFETLIQASREHAHRSPGNCKTCAARLAQAIERYRGDFLAQFFLADSAQFEDWAVAKREVFQRLAMQALAQLVVYHERRGEYAQAESYSRRQLEIEPWREEGHRQLMRLLVLSDQRSAALAQFERMRRILDEELGVEPESETVTLYSAILAQDQELPDEAQWLSYPARRPHNLPPQLTPFIGRDAELAKINALLEGPTHRLVTLIGVGGIGKTRLAIQAAAEQLDFFADGVYFVPLAALGAPDFIPSEILASLKAAVSEAASPKEQTLTHLKDKELLLVLDNFEHLVEGAALLPAILAAAPRVSLLVTSRERLKLHDERVVEVQGLPFPLEEQGPQRDDYGAVELYVRSAQRLQPGFELRAQDRECIGRICRLLEGMPLAIELAAAWTRLLSCQEIETELSGNLDFLAGSLRDAPARHASLRAVFDHSWELLTAAEQAAFGRLSVFRGGFQRSAAESVADANLALLGALHEKSLIRRLPSGRYELHELSRQYAFQKLEASGQLSEVRQRHFSYVLELAEKATAELDGSHNAAWLRRLDEEMDNLRAALEWSLAAASTEAGLRLGAALFRFWYWHNHYREGRRWLETLLEAAGGLEAPLPADLLAKALYSSAVLASELGDIAWAVPRFERSLALRRSIGDVAGQAAVLNSLGVIAYGQQEFARARAFYEESLALRRELGQTTGLFVPLNNLGLLARAQEDYESARLYCQECLQLSKMLKNDAWIATSLGNLAAVSAHSGEYGQAQALYGESLRLRQEFGDLDGLAYSLEGLASVAADRADQADHAGAGRAAILFGAADALREKIGAPLAEVDRAANAGSLGHAREILGHAEFQQAWEKGRRMSLEQAIAFAA